jgi:hypothetical protein
MYQKSRDRIQDLEKIAAYPDTKVIRAVGKGN